VAPLQWPELYLRTGLLHRVAYGAVRRAAAVICASTAARADVVRKLDLDPGRVSVVPDAAAGAFRPADPAAVRERLGLSGPYLLSVGALDDPRKDVQGLVEAFAAWARAEEREETLVLAGPGDASALRTGGARVKAAGFVPDAELPGLYSGAGCFVTASRYEGFGLGALEALACGTPVAGYDAGAIPETAGPGALLAPPGDAPALMRAVGRICDDHELAQRLREEGRAHAARFSWRRTAELTWDVYEAVS
jgi:glycosyltransferase involved in cell wall biosynthesis